MFSLLIQLIILGGSYVHILFVSNACVQQLFLCMFFSKLTLMTGHALLFVQAAFSRPYEDCIDITAAFRNSQKLTQIHLLVIWYDWYNSFCRQKVRMGILFSYEISNLDWDTSAGNSICLIKLASFGRKCICKYSDDPIWATWWPVSLLNSLLNKLLLIGS